MAERHVRWLRPPQLQTFGGGERHATWLELFFDLCFVVAVAALAADLHHHASIGGIMRFAGLFVIVWWAWMGFTWYATAFDSDDVVYRLALLAAMLCILGLAANIERVEGGDSVGLVVAYVVLKVLLVGLFVRSRHHARTHRAFCTAYATGFAFAAALFLSSLLAKDTARYVIWGLAMLVELTTPVIAVRRAEGRVFDTSHIPERYGLFTLIVLGESIVAIAAATSGAGWEWQSALTAASGFVIAAGIWWIYFEYLGASLLHGSYLSSFVWGYGHYLIFASLAATGVGVHFAIDAQVANQSLATAERWILCGALAIFYLTVAIIQPTAQRRLQDSVVIGRVAVAGIALALGLLGGNIESLALTGLLALATVAVAIQESLMLGPGVASQTAVKGFGDRLEHERN